MKKIFLYAVAFFIVLFAARPYTAKASHASAGEITYEWLGDSTYRFIFTFYRDCSGILEPGSQALCLYNSCSSTGSYVTMNLLPIPGNGSVVGCAPTKCTNPTSPIPGFRKWVYAAVVTLPSQCNDWVFSTFIADRNPSVNLLNGTAEIFYVETHMNNVGALQGNNSPYFSVNPLPYRCLGQPTVYNNGAVDPDGDSLVTEMIVPQGGVMSCGAAPVNIAYVTTSPAYAVPNNPIQTNNTFTLQSLTGLMQFTPMMAGSAVLAVRIKEYRGGMLIGSMVREMEAQIMACGPPSPVPVFTLLPGSSVSGGDVYGCPGVPLTFCFKTTTSMLGAKLKVTDDHTITIPGSNVTYSGMFTDSVTGCFSWTPPSNTYGTFHLTMVATDTTCSTIPIYTAFTVPVHIGKLPVITITAAPDTNVLSATPVTFTATTTNCTSGTYQWQKNGVNVPGATSVTWTTSAIADMDVITCKLHCNDSCVSVKDTTSNKLTMHVFTSVEGVSAIRSTTLYPNPNNGAFTLKGYAVKETGMTIEVLNAIGQVVYHHYETVKAGTILKTITLDNVNSGIYLLRIKTNDGIEARGFTISK